MTDAPQRAAAKIFAKYLAYVRKAKLNDNFHSIQDVLNEMRPIRCIEHPGTKPFVTPFIGKQVDICEAFGFDIPESLRAFDLNIKRGNFYVKTEKKH